MFYERLHVSRGNQYGLAKNLKSTQLGPAECQPDEYALPRPSLYSKCINRAPLFPPFEAIPKNSIVKPPGICYIK